MRETEAFYDDLAPDYHLVYADWATSVEQQGEALGRIMAARLGPGPMRVLDCSCGIGTQVIGMARLGHEVFGTDLSRRAVDRARAEAHRAGVRARFGICDLRALEDAVPGGFDVVLSCDNALPHLLDEHDLRRGLQSMLSRLRDGGMILLTLRDYDGIVEERPTATTPSVSGEFGARRLVFQIWDWQADGRTYHFDHVMGQEEADGWRFKVRRGTYRAILRKELSGLLQEQGVGSVEWLMPSAAGFFQPVVIGFKHET